MPSQGWAKSRIVDQQAVSECILAAVEQAEAMAQTRSKPWSPAWADSRSRAPTAAAAWISARPREIEQRDINRAMDRAMRVQLQEDRMVLQVLPQDFVVDDQPGFHDPRR